MIATTPLASLPGALAELEQSALLLLLAEQEGSGRDMACERLARAVAMVQSARGLVVELTQETGRPPLHVLVGGRSAPEAAAVCPPPPPPGAHRRQAVGRGVGA
jgi:hypothetical protein